MITGQYEFDIRVVEAQKTGRKIHCSATRSLNDAKNTILNFERTGYSESHDLLIEKPIDRSAEYKGTLPNYAGNSDRNKIIKIYCRNCSNTRFGELNFPYPGQEILTSNDSGYYIAQCLKCHSAAYDNYNWYR